MQLGEQALSGGRSTCYICGDDTPKVAALLRDMQELVLECAGWPWGPCWWCEKGKQQNPFSNNFRRCKACHGVGERRRLGAGDWEIDARKQKTKKRKNSRDGCTPTG
jgi:hypothetical protein